LSFGNYDDIISAVLREKTPQAPPTLMAGIRAEISIIEAERAKLIPPSWLTQRFYRYAPTIVCFAMVGFFGVTASARGLTLDLRNPLDYAVSIFATEDSAPEINRQTIANIAAYNDRMTRAIDNVRVGQPQTVQSASEASAVVASDTVYAGAQYIVTGKLPAYMRSLSGVARADGSVYYERVPAKLIDSTIRDTDDLVSVLWIP